MNTLNIENLGPVQELEVELPEGGGVTVLRGTNGSGKSTVIEGVSRLMGGRAQHLSAADGSKRGTVELGDAVLSVTKSRTATRGELEVTGIESRLDVSSLVDPGIQDPEKADAKRVKALISLAKVEASPQMFYEVVGGQDAFDGLGVDHDTDDVLLLAARVKREIEKEARTVESAVDELRGKVKAITDEIADVDFDQMSDYEVLTDAVINARARKESLETQAENAMIDASRRSDYADQLQEMKALEPVDKLEQELEVAVSLRAGLKEKKQALEAELAEVNISLEQAEQKVSASMTNLARAKRQAQQVQELEEMLASNEVTPPTDDDWAAAEAAIAKAEMEAEQGNRIRLARERANLANDYQEEVKAKRKQAAKLRRTAAAVDEVLTSSVPAGCPLRIEAGRLVMATDRSQSELFADLSHGERWKVAIDIAAEQLPEGGLLTIPQEAWEGLATENRALVANHCRERGINALTAAVSDQENICVEQL